MPATCGICKHVERAAIEQQHVEGLSLRAVAKLHPGTTPWSLRRHFAHIPAIIAKVAAHELQQNAKTAKLPARVEALIIEAQQVLAKAKTEKRWIAAIAAIRENRHMLELLGRLSGEIRGIGAGEFVPGTGVAAAAANVTLNLPTGSVNVPTAAAKKDPRDLNRLVRAYYNLAPLREEDEDQPIM